MIGALTRYTRVLANNLNLRPWRRMTRAVWTAAAARAGLEALESRLFLSTTFYVSPSGNDSNSGTSSAHPWKTVAKASSAPLHAGDSLLFQGGKSFGGELDLGSGQGGSSSSPVTIGSYGSGRATIDSGTGRGIHLENVGNMVVENLVFVGGKGNGTNGIKLDALGHISNIKITNVDVSGYGNYGLFAYGNNGNSGYNNVSVTYSSFHNNTIAGIFFAGSGNGSNTNIYLGHLTVYNNPGFGNSATQVSGSGITLDSVNGGTVERCTIYNNGTNGNGGCGLWSYESNNLVFQYNESYSNHTIGGHDGDGFDFDMDTSNSIMQYNYAHNNDGNGLQLNNWANDNNNSGNIIRYNIAQNNGQKNNYAGIEVWGKIINAQIYNNVVYCSATGGAPQAIKIHNATVPGLYVSNLDIYNNILITTGGRPMITVTSAELSGAKGLQFVDNVYYNASGSFDISYGSNYGSLSSFASSTGQEKVSGKVVGLQENPKLNSPGTAGTLNNADKLSTLTQYELQSSSPLLNRSAQIEPAYATTSSSMRDFYGNALPSAKASIVPGIQQPSGGVVSSSPPPSTPTAGFSSVNIGNPGHAGSATDSNGTYTVKGGGTNIWGTSDSFQYDYQSLTGDGQIIARVTSLSGGSAWTKAGLMIRSSTSASAQEVSLFETPSSGADLEVRGSSGGSSSYAHSDAKTKVGEWIKLVRSGNTFTGYVSANGSTWYSIGSTTVSMSSDVLIGLAVSSVSNSDLATAVFNDVSVVD